MNIESQDVGWVYGFSMIFAGFLLLRLAVLLLLVAKCSGFLELLDLVLLVVVGDQLAADLAE